MNDERRTRMALIVDIWSSFRSAWLLSIDFPNASSICWINRLIPGEITVGGVVALGNEKISRIVGMELLRKKFDDLFWIVQLLITGFVWFVHQVKIESNWLNWQYTNELHREHWSIVDPELDSDAVGVDDVWEKLTYSIVRLHATIGMARSLFTHIRLLRWMCQLIYYHRQPIFVGIIHQLDDWWRIESYSLLCDVELPISSLEPSEWNTREAVWADQMIRLIDCCQRRISIMILCCREDVRQNQHTMIEIIGETWNESTSRRSNTGRLCVDNKNLYTQSCGNDDNEDLPRSEETNRISVRGLLHQAYSWSSRLC